MGKLITTEMFVRDVKELHSNRYSYLHTEYKNSKEKVIVTCAIHGNFLITPSSHRCGSGCAKCKYVTVGNSNRGNLQDALNKCKEVHKDTYDYSLVTEYKHSREKIDVACPVHGVFQTTWDNHKRGKGCPACKNIKIGDALRGNLQDAITKCKLKHNSKYDYSLITSYSGNTQKVPILCPTHGEFQQQWSNHISGQGCPKCQTNGYNKDKPGTFYILTSGNITKVGITNRELKHRIRNVSKSSGKEFVEHSAFHFTDGVMAADLELRVLQWLTSNYKPVEDVFDGSTECFQNVDLYLLISFILYHHTH